MGSCPSFPTQYYITLYLGSIVYTDDNKVELLKFSGSRGISCGIVV